MTRSNWSTRSLASNHRRRTPLPGTTMSPSCCAFRSRMATAMSPVRTVVLVHCGSVRVVDATYLGRPFNAEPIVLVAISGIAPQERAKISYAVFCLKKKNNEGDHDRKQTQSKTEGLMRQAQWLTVGGTWSQELDSA